MKTVLGGLTALSAWALLCIFWYQSELYTEDAQVVTAGIATAGMRTAPPAPLEVYQNGDLLFKSSTGVSANPGSAAVRFTDGAYNLADDLSQHLKIHPDKALVVLSRYAQDESTEDSDKSRNIGLLRAEQFRKELVLRGLSPSSIAVLAVEDPDVFTNRSNTSKGLFDFLIKPKDQLLSFLKAHGAATSTDFQFELTRNIQFEYGKAEIDLQHIANQGIGEYFNLLADYLNQAGDKHVQIEGHTCDVSSNAFNERLALQRAEAVRIALEKRGVPSNRITTISAGEDRPLANNLTDAGKHANRRVEIIIR